MEACGEEVVIMVKIMELAGNLLRHLGLLLGLAILIGCSQQVDYTPDNRPNIICIMVDDLGFGDLSIQGATDLNTPHIDQIAKDGITLNNFYANCTVCSPTRAALITGKYPDLVGVPGVIRQIPDMNWGYLNPEEPTIGHLMKEAGYHSALIGKWHLGYESPNIPNDKGFDHFHGFLGDMMDDYWTHQRGGENWMRLNQEEINPEGHATDLFTDWTLDYLKDRLNEPEPFLLLLTYNAPHFPIQPPPEWLDKVSQREPQLDSARAANVAFIEHLDFNIGRITEYLKSNDMIDNTILCFTSDNGGALRFAQRNLPLRGGKQEHFEGGIKVPTFIYWKNHWEGGQNINSLGLTMDLFPTFCDIAGVPVPDNTDGISLIPILNNNELENKNRFVCWMRREGWHYGGQTYYAARMGDYKILQNSAFEPFQLFNIAEDPYEQNPLNTADYEIYNTLRNKLTAHILSSGAIPWQKEN